MNGKDSGTPDAVVTVSSNTLFHFTNNYENLRGILEREFQPRFCLETFLNSGQVVSEFAFPMVCFCDLPLSQTGTHLGFYGNYGIGLTKTWGRIRQISPVLYAPEESQVVENLRSLYRDLKKQTDEVPGPLLNHFYQLICYIKPYEGRFWRGGKYMENVRFYNEREWRYVPLAAREKSLFLSRDEFLNDEIRSSRNAAVGEAHQLGFEPNDIRYIIVANETEILRLVDDIMQIKGDKYTRNDLRLLTTRIISAEQIRQDF
jgi:hypothetical protein